MVPINKCNKYIKEVLMHSDNGPPQALEEKRHILPKNVKGDNTKVIKIKSKDYKNHNYLLGKTFITLIHVDHSILECNLCQEKIEITSVIPLS
jgi:hypothetical protein